MLSSSSLVRSLTKMNSGTCYPNPCLQVKESCYLVSRDANFVHIDVQAVNDAAESIILQNSGKKFQAEVEWDSGGWHYTDGGPRTCQYVFVMDALNFCFWPMPGLEYDILAKSLKDVLETDTAAFDADRLAVISEVNAILKTFSANVSRV
jgi:Potential Queuosine, Q, salvage protein family